MCSLAHYRRVKLLTSSFSASGGPVVARHHVWVTDRTLFEAAPHNGVNSVQSLRYFRPSPNQEKERRDRALAALKEATLPQIEFGSDRLLTRDILDVASTSGGVIKVPNLSISQALRVCIYTLHGHWRGTKVFQRDNWNSTESDMRFGRSPSAVGRGSSRWKMPS